jgi:hypothetical protein
VFHACTELDLQVDRSTTIKDDRSTLIEKKIKFSSYIRKFRVEKLQSHI